MKVLYTALLALLLFPSCRRQSGDIDSFLHNAESLMNEHPEDALSIIRHIDRRKIYSSASEARYALLYSQALDKNYVDVTSDSLTAVAVNYYDRHGTKHERAMAHYYQGRVPATPIHPLAGNDLSAQLNYCRRIRIVRTPTILVDNRRLPALYDAEDLKILL